MWLKAAGISVDPITRFQSTHPYGMWRAWKDTFPSHSGFQSTHPYGMWPVPLVCCVVHFEFQSTHPYGMWRRVFYDLWLWSWGFNPHIPTGCDLMIPGIAVDASLFQSTHPYGMWPDIDDRLSRRYKVSIHTSLRDVTNKTATVEPTAEFQSTHPYGMWLFLRSNIPETIFLFQSTHPYGMWPQESRTQWFSEFPFTFPLKLVLL